MECEGINDFYKRDVLKSFLRDSKCDPICLQEAKLEDFSLSVIRSFGFVFLKVAGASGGIIVM